MGKPVVIFRADGHTQMGLGHLVRSTALAEMLSPGFDCFLVYQHCPPLLLAGWQGVYIDTLSISPEASMAEDADQLLAYAKSLAGNNRCVLVLDGYQFGTAYQRQVIVPEIKLVCIDDIHAYHFLANVIINHSGGIGVDKYSAEPYTKFYLGPQYALLRAAFRNRPTAGNSSDNQKAFICLGGSDPTNSTLRVLELCLHHYPTYSFDIVIGAAYGHRRQLVKFIETSAANVQLHNNLCDEAMADLMAASTFGITSPSTVSFEYLSVGKTLYLLQTADNQADIYDYYLKSNLAFSLLDTFPLEDARQIADSLQRRKTLFDGQMQRRYLQLFNSLLK